MFSIEHLHKLRGAELDVIAARMQAGARVLELGAGTGAQARELSKRGYDVTAVDIADSNYANEQVFPVQAYNGRTLPFGDGTFDIVFSSNVLEHVAELASLHAEAKRVLRPGGKCIHVMPTDGWRFWTTVSAFPVAAQHLTEHMPQLLPRAISRTEARRLLSAGHRALAYATIPLRQKRHGERGSLLTEQYYFRPAWWRRHFQQQGFALVHEAPIGIFYTGHMVLNSLSIERRKQMSRWLGSACHLFELTPTNSS
jgi:SAM-dependent methyltransferase